VAADSQESGNITPATDHKRKGTYALFKKRFKVALGCMAIRTQTGLMIRRLQFMKSKRSCNSGSMRWKYERVPFRIWAITGKTMMRIICFDHITTATTPHRNLYLMERTSYRYNYKVIYT